MKGYPKDFSPWSQPYFHGREPQKELKISKTIETRNATCDYSLNTKDIPEGTETIYIEGNYDDSNGTELTISFINYEVKENKSYATELKKYQKDLATHKAAVTNWGRLKKKYDKEQKAKADEAELAAYQRLKKKFGDK